MLIEHYDLDVFTPPCEPGAERFSAIARLTVDISEVLPYLNATLRGAIYHRAANALTWKKGGHNLAFHAFQIATSNVEDYDAAVKEIDGLDQADQSHLGAPIGDHARLRDPSTSAVDDGVQAAAADQLQAVRRADVLFVCDQAGGVAEETRRLPAVA